MRIATKAQRKQVLANIKENLTGKGYQLETFEGLQFFTKHYAELNRWYLQAYRDNSTKPILNFYYKDAESMNKRIEQTKENYKKIADYKAERKANQKGRLTGAAACADAIRKELKEKMPHIKFSVRSSTFSGGDSVDISWKDGATVKEVEAIVDRYQYGHFNGMEDIYEYSNNIEGLPQAKYISTHRDMSEETSNILQPVAKKIYDDLKSNDSFITYRIYDYTNFLHRIFYETSFKNGCNAIDLKQIVTEPYFEIVFEGEEIKPKEVKEVVKPEIKEGSVNIIEYGKGIAVIGETYPIKDKLKAIGGRFNKFLTCGAGWVFSKDKFDEIKTMLLEDKKQKEAVIVQPIEESEPQETKTTLNDEINNTLDFFAQTDLKNNGKISESTMQCFETQKPEIFTDLKELEQAAKGGQVISLLNMYDLVNQRKAIY